MYPAFLKTLPLAKIPGVGKFPPPNWENNRVKTCGDIQQCDLAMLLKRFGRVAGYYGDASQGIDERDVNSERLRKSVGVERITLAGLFMSGRTARPLLNIYIRNWSVVTGYKVSPIY